MCGGLRFPPKTPLDLGLLYAPIRSLLGLGVRLWLSSGDMAVCLKLLYAKEEIKVLLPSASKV